MLTSVRKEIAEKVAELGWYEKEEALGLFETPKKIEHGHISLPVFQLSKKRRKAPPILASELSGLLDIEIQAGKIRGVKKASSVAGFVNFEIESIYLQNQVLGSIRDQGETLGYSQKGSEKTLVIDYASPNVAKPMSIGHLRATVIGQAIYNLAKTQGYKVVGVNHLGDWGVQFGKLAWAFQNWGDQYPFDEEPFESLFKLYVRFHEEAEKDPELDRLGSLTFRALEQGDEEITAIWKKFLEISLKEYQKLFDRLGATHDMVRGESFFNDRLKDTEKRIEDAGLLEESDGAQVVQMEGDLPPCLIRKSDGSSLYATRDLAAAIYRREELKADMNLYVVGIDQNLHFQQVFQVLRKMDYEWSNDCHHIAFGMYRFSDGKMSTRKGNVIFLDDVLNKSVELVSKLIEEKNPHLENKEEVAEQVGVGAIIFNDLINDRVRNVDFHWDKVLDFEGASGPYVQYCQVRCNSILDKADRSLPDLFAHELVELEEKNLLFLLSQYPDVLEKAFEKFKPHLLAQYVVDVGRAFNHFYQKCRVLGAEPSVEESRLLLVQCTRDILKAGLGVLNIQSPKAM